MTMVWHYTIKDRAMGIISMGEILPAIGGIPPNEKPAVWFSANKVWEPTANKIAVFYRTGPRNLTTREMFEYLGGELFRFGVSVDEEGILPFFLLKRAIRMSSKEARRLTKRAYAVKSSPIHWYGYVGSFPVEKTVIQRYNPINKQWEDYNHERA